jgi:hypothetical protein
MLKHLMYPKTGWIVLHIVATIALFLLGYSIHF